MFRLTMICDLQHPQARGKEACHSRSNRNPEGEGKTVDEAFRDVRYNKAKGWRRRVFKHMGFRMGWVCPVCIKIAERERDAGKR